MLLCTCVARAVPTELSALIESLIASTLRGLQFSCHARSDELAAPFRGGGGQCTVIGKARTSTAGILVHLRKDPDRVQSGQYEGAEELLRREKTLKKHLLNSLKVPLSWTGCTADGSVRNRRRNTKMSHWSRKQHRAQTLPLRMEGGETYDTQTRRLHPEVTKQMPVNP